MRSFVVRIWEDEHGAAALRGVVDDIATGQRMAFHAGPALLDALASALGTGWPASDPDNEAAASDPEVT
jgi:hypothetical protein